VTVSRATLHNESEVQKKDVCPGDTVKIARAGDVIPEVVKRVKRPGKKRKSGFSMPEKCPACGATVTREKAYYFCTAGLSYPAQIIGKVIHFASRDAMNIEGLGEKTVKQLVRRNMITNMADLYALSIDDIKSLEGFSEKSAKQLYEAIQATKNPRLERFLYGLGIRHVGRRVARVLAGQFRRLEKVKNATEQQLRNIPEIGPEIAASVKRFFEQKENKKTLSEMKEAGVTVKDMPRRDKHAKSLDGTTFVFTGTLKQFTRDEAKAQVETLGGRATSSVSTETDYLVAGTKPSTKLDEARNQGITILDEDAFEEMIQD
jgi:DNA ligase (NAD+)